MVNCELCNSRPATTTITGDHFVISVCDECYSRKQREVIVKEIKPMGKRNNFDTVENLNKRGEQTINKNVTGFHRLGMYENKKTGVKNFDSVTLIYRLTMLGLLGAMTIWLIKIFMIGSMF